MSEARDFVRDPTAVNDNLLKRFVDASIEEASHKLGRAVRTERRRWSFPQIPDSPAYIEPFAEANFSIERFSTDTFEELDAGQYAIEPDAGAVYAAVTDYPGFPRPDTNGSRPPFVYRITADCGWSAADLPADLRSAILIRVKELYDDRGIRDIGRPLIEPFKRVQHYNRRLG